MSYDRNSLRPLPGTLWAWEPRAEHAACLIKVTGVRWNGEEWYVGAEVIAGTAGTEVSGNVWWNDLDRFWEACHYVAAEPGPGSGLARRGAPQPDELGKDGNP